jgi:hypothetical protein
VLVAIVPGGVGTPEVPEGFEFGSRALSPYVWATWSKQRITDRASRSVGCQLLHNSAPALSCKPPWLSSRMRIQTVASCW